MVGKSAQEAKPTVTEPEDQASGVLQSQKSDQTLIIAGAPVDEKKDYPTEALKHMQQKPLVSNYPFTPRVKKRLRFAFINLINVESALNFG